MGSRKRGGRGGLRCGSGGKGSLFSFLFSGRKINRTGNLPDEKVGMEKEGLNVYNKCLVKSV